MHPMLNVAIQAIRTAGNFVIKQYEFVDKHNNTTPNYINNFIQKTHKTSNYIITKIIKKFYPLHSIITTYDNNNTYFNNNVYWIIESIDNNINYIRQFPFFTLSIAVQLQGKIEIGVIYDPIHNELFSACRGKGAQLNGYKIRVNTTKDLKKSILAIYCIHEKKHVVINLLKKLYNQHINFRCTGTIVLDLAYIAVGRIDGCLAIFTKKTKKKLASSTLLVRESGGLIVKLTEPENQDNSTKKIIAGNPKIIKTLLSIIQY